MKRAVIHKRNEKDGFINVRADRFVLDGEYLYFYLDKELDYELVGMILWENVESAVLTDGTDGR